MCSSWQPWKGKRPTSTPGMSHPAGALHLCDGWAGGLDPWAGWGSARAQHFPCTAPPRSSPAELRQPAARQLPTPPAPVPPLCATPPAASLPRPLPLPRSPLPHVAVRLARPRLRRVAAAAARVHVRLGVGGRRQQHGRVADRHDIVVPVVEHQAVLLHGVHLKGDCRGACAVVAAAGHARLRTAARAAHCHPCAGPCGGPSAASHCRQAPGWVPAGWRPGALRRARPRHCYQPDAGGTTSARLEFVSTGLCSRRRPCVPQAP